MANQSLNIVPPTGTFLIDPSASKKEIMEAINYKTFVGIDFGTSTTVLASRILIQKTGPELAR